MPDGPRFYCVLDEVVAVPVEVVVGELVSAGSDVVVIVEELSGGVPDAEVDSPDTAGVEVELTNGGRFSIYEPFGCIAYWPSSRSPLEVSYK